MRKFIAKLLPAVFRSRRKQKQHKQQTLLKLPNEILCEIGCFIPPISRACLALSCKRLLSVYGEALSSPDIHFPRSFQRRTRNRRRFDSLSSERWKFLGYLENRRWQRCSRCLKLHPVSEFSRAALRKPAEERECNMGKYAGIVELCPCIRLTFRDKLRLMDELRLDPRRPRSLADLDLSANSPHEFHSCTIPGPQTFFTRIFLVLEDDGLRVTTIYDATYSEPGWNKLIPARLICPHLDAITYLREMRWATFWPNMPGIVPYYLARRYMFCPWCGMSFGSHRAKYTDHQTIARARFKTTRYLGENSQVPGEIWFNQTVYCQDPPADPNGQDADPTGHLHRFQVRGRPDWN